RPAWRRPARGDARLGRHRLRVTVHTGVAPADGAAHEEHRRLQVELLGGLLADAHARPATAGTELLRLSQVTNDLAARQVLGQGAAAVLVASPGRLVVGLGLAPFGPPLRTAADAVRHGALS